ncbi:class I SAM-dependent methyltransferase [Arenimonas composti]|uniref:Methyltransferase type 11 domain-containing protein n=1 Tax=Arenimonas composti TR7-09 = DSM 18010 TaxID=1121013 RepID=A0A091BYB5_9GAMM|nr:class I SAM-dependent methyltransferase [Arenimonas composti]KFN49335.1 hypothetical protein P873_11220 [Arenimonas composti TR7-09 = DSM 18010]
MRLHRLKQLLRRPPPAPEPPAARDFGALAEWQAWLRDDGELAAAQHCILSAVPTVAGGRAWPGWCGLCRRPAHFALRAGSTAGDLREQLECAHCGLNARHRAALSALLAGQSRQARVYLTEQASPAYVWLRARLPRAEGSEYGLAPDVRARMQRYYEAIGGHGALVERDVTALAFADASLDAIGSFDVLEHVPDYAAALHEFARVLRPGGRLVLTAPFLDDTQATEVLARRRADGGIEHLLDPPELHADPLGDGVLCWYHFGWDLLDTLRATGFRHAAWQRAFDPREAIFGLWTLVAHR